MTPTPEDIAHRIINAATGLFTVAHPDPDRAHVFVWSSGAPEQLAAIIESELAPLRELAEIGRLAVVREQVWRIPLGDVDGKVVDGIEAAMKYAIDAYLAKQKESA